MNVVFDTNILISSTLFENSLAKKLLIKLIGDNIKIFSSNEILLEYYDVLKKDFHFDNNLCQSYLNEILSFLDIIEPIEKIDIVKEDPDDNKILECAIASKSNYVITNDNHLLKLKEFRGIKIVIPEDALKIISQL